MAYNNTVTLVGNATRDPELRFTPSGTPVCTFGVAWNRKYERDGEEVEEVSFFDVTCWQKLAENVADSVEKGTRVIVHGRLDQRSWENDDGEKRHKVELVADEVAPSLRWATATVDRNSRDDDRDGGRRTTRSRPSPRRGEREAPARPAAGNKPSYGDEEPF